MKSFAHQGPALTVACKPNHFHNMKIILKRVIKFDSKPSQPDYETFFRGQNSRLFHGVGYLGATSSDITLKIKPADLTNRYQSKSYNDYWKDIL